MINTKTNGYKAEGLQPMIEQFNKAARKLFAVCRIEHFYYGDTLDMVTIYLEHGYYGHFNITKNRVSFDGHTCDHSVYERFCKLTYNDELFDGKLFEIA